MSDKLRLGIVGVGGMGIANYHTRTFLDTGEVEIVACCDIQQEALDKFSERFGVPARHRDLEAMLSEERLDIVNICTNETLHAPMTVQAAKHRPKAILCEKPMAMSLAEADGMLETCRDNGVLLVIGHQRRYMPQYARAKELLKEGVIGELEQIQAVGHAPSSLLPDGTHTADLIRFYADDAPIEWLIGQADFRSRRRHWGHVLEDAVVALYKFETGVRAIQTAGGHITPKRDALGPHKPFQYHHISLFGSKGQIEIGGDAPTGDTPILRILRGDNMEAVEVGGGWHRGISPHFELLECLKDGHKHPLDGSSAHANLEVLMAIFESARLRRLVTFPLENRENPLEQMLAETDG